MDKVYKKVALGAFILMFGAGLVTSCFSYFVQPITSELGYERSTFTLYYTLLGIVTMVFMPIISKMAGKVGVKKIVLVGGIWTTLGFVALSRCTSLISFYITGALMGVFAQICTNVMAIITINTWFIARKGSIMGIVGAASGVCGAIAGVVLPSFIATQGWRNGYLLLAAAVFLCTVPVSLFLIKDSPQSVGLQPLGFKETKDNQTAEVQGVPYAKAIKSKQFILIYLSFLLIAIVAGVIQHLPAYFTGKGMTPVQAGSIMSIFMLAMIGAKILMGMLNDKLGVSKTATFIFTSFAVACLVMPFMIRFGAVAGDMILMSFGFGSLSVLAPLIANKIFGQKDFAGIWGILATSMALGSAIGAPIWGAFYDNLGSYDMGFYLSTAVLIGVIFIIFYCLKSSQKLNEQVTN